MDNSPQRSATYSETLVSIFNILGTPEGIVRVRHLMKRDLKAIYEHDLLVSMSRPMPQRIRLAMYKYMRRFIRTFAPDTKQTVHDFWLYLKRSYQTLEASGLLDFATGAAAETANEIVDLCNTDVDDDDRDGDGDDDGAALMPTTSAADATLPLMTEETLSASEAGSIVMCDEPVQVASHLKLNIDALLQKTDSMLTITLSRSKWNRLQLQLAATSPRILRLSLDAGPAAATRPIPMLTTAELLHWPGMAMRVRLGEVECYRCVRPNYERQIVSGTDAMRHLDRTTNDTRTRSCRVFVSAAEAAAAKACSWPDHPKQLSSLVYETFLTKMVHCLGTVKLNPYRRNDLKTVFRILLKESADIAKMYRGRCYTQLKCANRFVRLLTTTAATEAGQQQRVWLRETINPETEFVMVKCPFVSGVDEEEWSEELYQYFETVLVQRHQKKTDRMREAFNGCLQFECVECGVKFTGYASLVYAKEHVRRVHDVVADRWRCVRCGWQPVDGRMCADFVQHRCAVATADV